MPTGSTKDAVIDRGVLAQADAWRQRTGGRCFAASNQEHHRVAYLREQAGLGRHFDEIIYSAALGVCKPDRVFFTTAQARMGVTAAQSILFVDDRRPTSTAPGPAAGGRCSIAGRKASAASWKLGLDEICQATADPAPSGRRKLC